MKRYLFSIACVVFVFCATAQNNPEETQSPYVFPAFESGTIYFTNGDETEKKLNYNGVTEEMIYWADGRKLAVDNLSEIDKILIKNRLFIPSDGKFFEKISECQAGPYIRYNYRLEGPEKPSGYGSSSQTTATTSYTTLTDDKMYYELKLPADFKVVRSSSFYFTNGTEWAEVSNKRHAWKLYGNEHKDQIKRFVKKQKINFSATDDMVKLGEFLNGLK